MTTMRSVAERARVSVATVSHVINQTRPVSEGLRQRVLAAMVELDYQPNLVARSLRRGQSDIIGMVVSDIANPFFAEIARGVADTCYQQDYHLILCNSDNDPDKVSLYIEVLIKQQVDGILFVSVDLSGETFHGLLAQRIPLVNVLRDLPGGALDVIMTDNIRGGYLAARHLTELGHRRIGCISGPLETSPSTERITGYRQALQKAGITADEKLIQTGDFQYAGGYQAACQLLSLEDPPTAIFAFNDMMAIGALCAAQEKGYKVPVDLSVVGYDDISLASYTSPPLTTVFQPKHEVGLLAAIMLLERIREHDLAPRRRLLDISLMVRQSSAPPSRRS